MTYTRTHVHPVYGLEAEMNVAVDGCEDLDDEVCLRSALHWRPDRGETQANARIVGYVIAHDVEGQEARCEGACMTEIGFGPTQIWAATGSLERGDLTLSPSVQCSTHPAFHGLVRSGRWVPA